MGGGGSSSSSTSNTTEQKDQRVATGDGGVAVGAGATVSIDATDSEAFDLGKEAIALVGNIGGQVWSDLMDFNREQADKTTELQTKQIEWLDKQSSSEQSNLGDAIVKIGLPALALVMVARTFGGK